DRGLIFGAQVGLQVAPGGIAASLDSIGGAVLLYLFWGSHTRKVDPRPSSLSTVMLPPNTSRSRFTIWSPSPVPPDWRVAESSICRNGSNIASSASCGIPMPVSLTLNSTPALQFRAATVMLPALVNFTALPIRFLSTTLSLPASVYSRG